MSTIRALGNIEKIFAVNVSVDVGSNSAATTLDTTVTVQGVLPGDKVIVNKPSTNTGLGIANARVSAANTIILTTINATAGAINPAAETYSFIILRPESTPPSSFQA